MRKISSFFVMFAVSASIASFSHAQQLKPAEQRKVTLLRARLNKAVAAQNQANAKLSSYRVFRIMGKIQAGDSNVASVYGKAIPTTDFRGAGALHEDTYLTVKVPTEENYEGSNFFGDCIFLGVQNGTNTYLPVAHQPDYLKAVAEFNKWAPITSSIQAEIDAIYLPYQRKAKNRASAQAAAQTRLAQEKRQKEEAQAAVEAENQARVNEAREQLAEEKRGLELAKKERVTKQAADAEIARLAEELKKTRIEKARLDAEAQKQAQEEANRKAKELREDEERNQASIQALQATPSIIEGVQLGKVRLGMAAFQVLQLLGTPDSSLQLRKVEKAENNERVAHYVSFVPRRIRRDRYFLKPTEGMDIVYEGSSSALNYLATERGIKTVKSGDLKSEFVFDVFYLADKVVQLESDSPQFFTAEKRNIQSDFSFEKGYESRLIIDYRGTPNRGVTWGGAGGTEMFGSFYTGSREKGISLRFEALSAYNGQVEAVPSPLPISRRKLIIHSPNTVPYTGDYQLGISLLNQKDGRSDADNVEERKYSSDLNPLVAQTVVSNVVEPKKDRLKEKVKRGIGRFLPRR